MNYANEVAVRHRERYLLQVAKEHGPVPINIFAQLRSDHDLKLVDLERKAFVGKHALIRLEQGTYVTPLPSVTDFWVKSHGYSELHLRDAYEHYQMLMRKRHGNYFGASLEFDTTVPKHPLRQVRERVYANLTEVAKDICVPQGTLSYFEKKWRNQQSVPKALVEALYGNGYRRGAVGDFCSDYERWRGRFNGTVFDTEQANMGRRHLRLVN